MTSNRTKQKDRQKVRQSSSQRRRRPVAHQSTARKQTTPSALAHDPATSGNCDSSFRVGIRTRRMSAAEVVVNQKPSADLSAVEDVEVDNCSCLSSTSTAAVTANTSVPAEVAGLFLILSYELQKAVLQF